MRCEQALELIHNQLDTGEPGGDALLSHLETCDNCRRRQAAYQAMCSAMSSAEQVDAPPSLLPGLRYRIDSQRPSKRFIFGRFSAAAAILVVMLMAWYFYTPNKATDLYLESAQPTSQPLPESLLTLDSVPPGSAEESAYEGFYETPAVADLSGDTVSRDIKEEGEQDSAATEPEDTAQSAAESAIEFDASPSAAAEPDISYAALDDTALEADDGASVGGQPETQGKASSPWPWMLLAAGLIFGAAAGVIFRKRI